MNKVDGKAVVLLIEFAGGFADAGANKLDNNTVKIYRNAARLLHNCNNIEPINKNLCDN